ncbi:MAG: hypothetical protein ABMB14_16990, partial [Myxococcota bacterium]
ERDGCVRVRVAVVGGRNGDFTALGGSAFDDDDVLDELWRYRSVPGGGGTGDPPAAWVEAWLPIPGSGAEPAGADDDGAEVAIAVVVRADGSWEARGHDGAEPEQLVGRLVDPLPRPVGAAPDPDHLEVRWLSASVPRPTARTTHHVARVGPVIRERQVIATPTPCAICGGRGIRGVPGRTGERPCVTCGGTGVRAVNEVVIDR